MSGTGTAGLNATRGLTALSIIGVSYFGLVILVLSLFDADYSPVSEAASDYGVGRFAVQMNVGFFVAGIGLIAFALAIARERRTRRSRAGTVLFFIAGLVLIMDSYFTTNLPNGPSTLHGTIHGLGGFVFFITAPAGVLLVSRKFSLSRLLVALAGLLVGFTMLVASAGDAGLAERIILLVIFSFVIVTSIDVARESGPR